MKKLIREEPNQEEQIYDWTAETQKKFKLDPGEVVRLESGRVMWDGAVAYSLEDVEETES